MIELNGEHNRIKVNISAYPMGRDLCILITGGDTPHLGALTAASPDMQAQTIAFGTHKEYHVTDMAVRLLREDYAGNFVVCCGIHLDDIEKHEIADVLELTEKMVRELCERLKAGNQE